MLIRSTAILVSLLALAACQPQTVDTSCVAFQPIRYSGAGDTPETVQAVREHNAAWVRLCGKR